MRDRASTVRSRELGEGLRQAMEGADLNGKQAARVLGWSESWVSRILAGKRGSAALDVAAFLGACRVKDPERDRLLALCQDQHNPGWLQQHGSRLPAQLMTLIKHEDKTVAISDFEVIVVPGLLQTGDYARALISRSGNIPAGEVEERVTARLARQLLFSQERPARFTFYLHESVLHTPVGGPAVMSDQLHHLLRMLVRSHVTVRVVPAALGAHAARTTMTAPEPDGIVWRTSSYSAESGACVQVGWRKSSYSAESGNCVEVAWAPERVLVRDSKNPGGPALAVAPSAWRTLLSTVTG